MRLVLPGAGTGPLIAASGPGRAQLSLGPYGTRRRRIAAAGPIQRDTKASSEFRRGGLARPGNGFIELSFTEEQLTLMFQPTFHGNHDGGSVTAREAAP